jgi:RNA polymerase sigma-70 factor, ECF subfamily
MNTASNTPGTPSQPPIPAAVIAGACKGDPSALAALFEACFDDIYALAARMLGDRTQAEDVVQEVFLRLHKAAANLDPQRDPRPWLRTITANLCRDHFRSFGARVTRESVSVDAEPGSAAPLSSDGPAPDADLLDREKTDQVLAAVDQLPEPLREIVLLRDYENLSHDEIAEIVGASGAAVRKRYSRALSALGDLLQDVWP